jgi:hypothetical protein
LQLSKYLALSAEGGSLKIPAYFLEEWGKSIPQIKDLFLELLIVITKIDEVNHFTPQI